MTEETWHAARLIPTSGINGAEEQERRATSALLAVMTAVREFGRAICTVVGAPAGHVEAFIEVPFELGDKRHYPDGLIRVRRGKRSWTALVEVKTSTNTLDAGQLDAYLDIARQEGFDALLTISNEIASSPTEHPTVLDKRKTRKVALHHLSWTQVLTLAVVQKVHRGVADPDQAWVLGELIRYLEHNRSGAMEFEDMGSSWVSVREEINRGTLRRTSKGVKEVASRWEQLLRYSCLRLGRQLGVEVQPGIARREAVDPIGRVDQVVDTMVESGVLEGAIRIPDAVAPLKLTADLRAGQITCSVELPAPAEGRPRARVNWLLRQLRDAPEDLRIDAFAVRARGASTSELLRTVRDDTQALIQDPRRELRSFRLIMKAPMGTKRGTGRGSFIGSVLELIDAFYTSVVQNLKLWQAPPPKLRPPPEDVRDPSVRPALASTDISSQDGAEPVTPSQAAPSTQGQGPAHTNPGPQRQERSSF